MPLTLTFVSCLLEPCRVSTDIAFPALVFLAQTPCFRRLVPCIRFICISLVFLVLYSLSPLCTGIVFESLILPFPISSLAPLAVT